MDWKAHLSAACLAVISLPAAADTFEITPDNASNYSAEFVGKTPSEVAAVIAAGCMDRQWSIKAMNDNLVECYGMHPNSATILMRNGREVVRFSIIPSNNGTRVQGSSLIVAQNGFGAVSEMRGALNVPVATILNDAGGKFTDGTRLVGPDFGFRSVNGNNRVLVFSVAPGSIAEKAGLQSGDQIQRIGKKWVWATWDIRKAIKGATAGQPIELTVKRGREELKIALVVSPSS